MARTIGNVPNSLSRTTVALLLAAIAVLVTAGIAMRDFILDVGTACPGTIVVEPVLTEGEELAVKDRMALPVVVPGTPSAPPDAATTFRVLYELDPGSSPAAYKNVRVQWVPPNSDSTCDCGSVPVTMSSTEGPWSLTLYKLPNTNRYLVKSGKAERAAFVVDPTTSHRMQIARIFSRRHLSLAVSFAAFLALGVAWLRQRKARAYALVMFEWREAELTSGQMIQSETGEMLGALQSTSRRIWQRAGKVLVAPEALGGNGLYRDVPVIEPRHVARGDHAEWQRATMMRLRDARAIAVLSTLTTALALAAHFFA